MWICSPSLMTTASRGTGIDSIILWSRSLSLFNSFQIFLITYFNSSMYGIIFFLIQFVFFNWLNICNQKHISHFVRLVLWFQSMVKSCCNSLWSNIRCMDGSTIILETRTTNQTNRVKIWLIINIIKLNKLEIILTGKIYNVLLCFFWY